MGAEKGIRFLRKAHVKKKKPGMHLTHLRRHTRRILSHAAENGLLDGIPVLRLTSAEKSQNRPRAFENAEIEPIFDTELGKKGFRDRTLAKYRLQLKLVLFCGLRPPSELNHLQYEFFDFNSGLLHLPGDFVKTREPRTIPVPEEILVEVKTWRAMASKKMRCSSYLFPHRRFPDRPATSSDKTWQRIKKAAGLSGKRYWFRHSHATAAIAAGMNAIEVAADMGTSTEMLSRVYVRPGKDTVKKRVDSVRQKYRGVK